MKVSVIIPTYNEENVIGECLRSLSRQSYENLEIIIVDDGSTDQTLAQCQMSDVKCQIQKQEHKGAGAARNLGAGRAKGDILVFIDADMTFDKDFIKKLVDPIVKGQAIGTFSKEEFLSNKDNIWAVNWNLNNGLPSYRMHKDNYPDKQKVFRAILKSEFEKSGGFDEKGGYTDDWSLSDRLGQVAVVARGAIFYHKNPGSLFEVFKHARWASKRKYKLGIIGGLAKAWLPIRPSLSFLFFKLIYGAAATLGVLEYYLFNKTYK